jgi:hypothetical protein
VPKLTRENPLGEEILEIGWFTPKDIQTIHLSEAGQTQLYAILKNLAGH